MAAQIGTPITFVHGQAMYTHCQHCAKPLHDTEAIAVMVTYTEGGVELVAHEECRFNMPTTYATLYTVPPTRYINE